MNPLDMPIDNFTASLPMRPRNCIKANFWSPFETDEHLKPPHTVRHLMMFSRKEIRRWPNLGKKSLNEIEEQLRSLGLQLWEEHDDRSLYPLINYASESVLQQRIAELEADNADLRRDEALNDAEKRIAELEKSNAQLLEFAQEWIAQQGTDENYMVSKARAAIAGVKP